MSQAGRRRLLAKDTGAPVAVSALIPRLLQWVRAVQTKVSWDRVSTHTLAESRHGRLGLSMLLVHVAGI